MHQVTYKYDGALVEETFLIDPLDMDALLVQQIFQAVKPPFGQFEHDLYIERITVRVRVPLVNDRDDVPPTSEMGFRAATSWPGESFISSFMETCKKPPYRLLHGRNDKPSIL